ncbi:MAG: hypothetical protein CVU39_12650 [Chloroflexi bacterium HGW-Chloroflexi-10]|nr:MAG: hypothetical protein CVU39_12650 [Chloroflexi bacterium HGW-Chloroflexi-10]
MIPNLTLPLKFVHLATMQAQVTQIINFGISPLGNRLDVIFEGDLTGEVITGKLKGVDYFALRPDGIGQVDVRGSILTNDEAVISVWISGYVIGSKFIDTNLKFVTGDDRYKWLNEKIVIGTGRGLPEGYVGLPERFEMEYYYAE